jgi:glycosidase
MKVYFRIGFLLLLLFLNNCQQKDRIPDPTMIAPAQTSKIVIYQMMTRLFGNTNTTNKPWGTITENGCGKFIDINDAALNGIKSLGVTHVWYTGVLEHATLTAYPGDSIAADHPFVVKGRAGSPYSIKDYYDVAPDLAVDVKHRMTEFESLVERTHNNDLKVIIDFVPNHVARQYKSDAKPAGVKDLGEGDDKTKAFAVNNNFYYLPGSQLQPPQEAVQRAFALGLPGTQNQYVENPAKVTGNGSFSPSPNQFDWFEAVKLNYGVDVQNNGKTYFDPIPRTWEMMRDILVYWANKKVDGFRCDMAEMVPVEFWNWVIPQVKAVNPGIIFIAEIYNPQQYQNYSSADGFDFLYDKVQLYDTLRFLLEGNRSGSDIGKVQESLKPLRGKMLHFMENHDEQRLASKYFAGDAWKAFPAMVVSATIDNGPVLIYFGQEVGEPAIGNQGFQNIEKEGVTTKMDYWGVSEHQKWVNGGKYDGGALSQEQKQLRDYYVELLNVSKNNPAIAKGEYVDITEFNLSQKNFSERVVAYVRYSGDQKLLIVVSFNSKLETVKVVIPQEIASRMGLDSKTAYTGRDLIGSGIEVGLPSNLETTFELPPFTGLVLKLKD